MKAVTVQCADYPEDELTVELETDGQVSIATHFPDALDEGTEANTPHRWRYIYLTRDDAIRIAEAILRASRKAVHT